MSTKFQCSLCSAVETSEPKRICSTCLYESVQIRNLSREMARRMAISSADIFVILRTGINKFVDQINGLKKLLGHDE